MSWQDIFAHKALFMILITFPSWQEFDNRVHESGIGVLASFFEDSPTSHWKTEMVRMHPLDAVLPRTPSALDSTPAIFCSSSENSSAQLPHCCVCQEAPPACPLHAWEEPGLSHSNRSFRQPPRFLTLNCQCALLPRNLLKTSFVVTSSSPLLCGFPHSLPSLFYYFRYLNLISSYLQRK